MIGNISTLRLTKNINNNTMETLEPLLPYIFGNGGALAFAIWTIMDKKKQIKEMREEHNKDLTDMLNQIGAMREEARHDNNRFYEHYRAMNEKSVIAMNNVANALEGLRELIKERV